jgi:hypothetical protein
MPLYFVKAIDVNGVCEYAGHILADSPVQAKIAFDQAQRTTAADPKEYERLRRTGELRLVAKKSESKNPKAVAAIMRGTYDA